ncbi:MAG TPA: flagellar basal-body MS-ring/collar protein FliF [Allosphingosinicella sp.]|jgi:flagellar M-ring protein FliF
METINLVPANQGRQIKLLAFVFAALFLVLAAGYYFFIRTEYAVLYSGLRPADASAIVAELDAKGVAYELKDQGTTILVPKAESDSVRLAIVGSDAPLKGSTGFELFNKSDMGLTDFAQKINYQRALQGELARTIMMMDGIENARVHLTIPERTLFRGNRSEPKAAVTLTLLRGKAVDEARVAGIQRLVAAAVPDLKLGDVVVLDEVGRIISSNSDAQADLPPELAERNAVQEYYRAHIRSAVEAVLPGLGADARVLIVPTASASDTGWEPAGAPAQAVKLQASSSNPAARNFQLRISVVTPAPLNFEDQERVRAALTRAVGLKPESGDSLNFGLKVEPVRTASPIVPPVTAEVGPDYRKAAVTPMASTTWLVAIAAIFCLLLVAFAVRVRSPTLTVEQRDAMVLRIRRQLSLMDGTGDARS